MPGNAIHVAPPPPRHRRAAAAPRGSPQPRTQRDRKRALQDREADARHQRPLGLQTRPPCCAASGAPGGNEFKGGGGGSCGRPPQRAPGVPAGSSACACTPAAARRRRHAQATHRTCSRSMRRSIKGASAAAPAIRNGRVTLLPAHMRMQICDVEIKAKTRNNFLSGGRGGAAGAASALLAARAHPLGAHSRPPAASRRAQAQECLSGGPGWPGCGQTATACPPASHPVSHPPRPPLHLHDIRHVGSGVEPGACLVPQKGQGEGDGVRHPIKQACR